MNKTRKAKALLSIILLVGLVMLVGCSNKTAATSQPAKVAKLEDVEPVIKTAALNDGVDLEGLTEDEKFYIENTLEKEGISANDVLAGKISVEEADRLQNDWIQTYVLGGNLPSNGQEIFNEYKEKTGYYDQFTEEHHEKPTVAEQQEVATPKQTAPASSTNKPQASQEQQTYQVENNTNEGGNGLQTLAEVKADLAASGNGRVVTFEEFKEAVTSGNHNGGIEASTSDAGIIYILYD